MFTNLVNQMNDTPAPNSWRNPGNDFSALTPEPVAPNSGSPAQMAQIEALRSKIARDSGGSLKFEGRRMSKKHARNLLSDYEQAAGIVNANTPLGGMLTPEPGNPVNIPKPVAPVQAVSRPQALPAGGVNPFADAAKQAGFSDFGGQAAQAKVLRAAPAALSGGTN